MNQVKEQVKEQPQLCQLRCFSHKGFLALLQFTGNIDMTQLKASTDNIRHEAKVSGLKITRVEVRERDMSLLSGNLGMRFYQYIPLHVKERLVSFPELSKALMEARSYFEVIHAGEFWIVH